MDIRQWSDIEYTHPPTFSSFNTFTFFKTTDLKSSYLNLFLNEGSKLVLIIPGVYKFTFKVRISKGEIYALGMTQLFRRDSNYIVDDVSSQVQRRYNHGPHKIDQM